MSGDRFWPVRSVASDRTVSLAAVHRFFDSQLCLIGGDGGGAGGVHCHHLPQESIDPISVRFGRDTLYTVPVPVRAEWWTGHCYGFHCLREVLDLPGVRVCMCVHSLSLPASRPASLPGRRGSRDISACRVSSSCSSSSCRSKPTGRGAQIALRLHRYRLQDPPRPSSSR